MLSKSIFQNLSSKIQNQNALNGDTYGYKYITSNTTVRSATTAATTTNIDTAPRATTSTNTTSTTITMNLFSSATSTTTNYLTLLVGLETI